jgi:PhoPQ-activated pathogenicity-related protein
MRYCKRASWITALALLAGTAASLPSLAADELTSYVTRADASYGFEAVRSGPLDSGEYVELILTSQTWRGVPWKHQLFVFRPKRVDSNARQALLYIDGGRWNPDYVSGRGDLPREARVFARLAAAIHAPVAVVRQVPFQPLFDLREDALIAYTFDRYLQTGDAEWPLLLPMVKSAVRAMDTVQTVAERQWNLKIERFTVTGASKRGWTSWLTAANDPRVASVAPMVIDMLNLPEQIRLQRDTFGGLSEQVQDYERIDLPKRLDSAHGHQLVGMVDPYSYRAKLVQPKLILLATNDRYWPLDALSLYWGELAEPKRVLYVPNQGHGLRDIDRLIGALSAVHRYSARREPLPTLGWRFAATGGKLEVDLQAGRKPRHVLAWTASSPTRDFRDARWSSHDCQITRDRIQCAQPAASPQYTALYSEVTFNDRGEYPFSLSTAVCIVDAAGAMVRPCLDNAGSVDTAKAH